MSFGHYPRRDTTELVDLLARRPELRDVGIAGYLAGAAVDGAGAAKTPETWLEVEAQPGGYIGYYLVYPRWRRWLIAREVAA